LPPAYCCSGLDQLELVRIGEAVDADLDATLEAAAQVDGAAAEGVEVVERPEVEQVDVVAAVHPRPGPQREARREHVLGLGEEVADGEARLEVAGVVEELAVEREGRDDPHPRAAGQPEERAELELGVGALLEARAVADHVRRRALAAVEVRGGADAPVAAELEAGEDLGGGGRGEEEDQERDQGACAHQAIPHPKRNSEVSDVRSRPQREGAVNGVASTTRAGRASNPRGRGGQPALRSALTAAATMGLAHRGVAASPSRLTTRPSPSSSTSRGRGRSDRRTSASKLLS
jgi:hypothetical protein